METFPDELLLWIFEATLTATAQQQQGQQRQCSKSWNACVRQLLTLRQVCGAWRRIASDATLWRRPDVVLADTLDASAYTAPPKLRSGTVRHRPTVLHVDAFSRLTCCAHLIRSLRLTHAAVDALSGWTTLVLPLKKTARTVTGHRCAASEWPPAPATDEAHRRFERLRLALPNVDCVAIDACLLSRLNCGGSALQQLLGAFSAAGIRRSIAATEGQSMLFYVDRFFLHVHAPLVRIDLKTVSGYDAWFPVHVQKAMQRLARDGTDLHVDNVSLTEWPFPDAILLSLQPMTRSNHLTIGRLDINCEYLTRARPDETAALVDIARCASMLRMFFGASADNDDRNAEEVSATLSLLESLVPVTRRRKPLTVVLWLCYYNGSEAVMLQLVDGLAALHGLRTPPPFTILLGPQPSTYNTWSAAVTARIDATDGAVTILGGE